MMAPIAMLLACIAVLLVGFESVQSVCHRPAEAYCSEMNANVRRNSHIVNGVGVSSIKTLCGLRGLHWDRCSRYNFAEYPQKPDHCPKILNCDTNPDLLDWGQEIVNQPEQSPSDIRRLTCDCNNASDVTSHLYSCFREGNCSFASDFNSTLCSCQRKKDYSQVEEEFHDDSALEQTTIHCVCNRTQDLVSARQLMERALYGIYANASHLSAYMNQTSSCVVSFSCFSTTETVAGEFASWIRDSVKPMLCNECLFSGNRKCGVTVPADNISLFIKLVLSYDMTDMYSSSACNFLKGIHQHNDCPQVFINRFQDLLITASEIIRGVECLMNVSAHLCTLADRCSATSALKRCMDSPGLHSNPIEHGDTALSWQTLKSEVVNTRVCTGNGNSIMESLCSLWFYPNQKKRSLYYPPC